MGFHKARGRTDMTYTVRRLVEKSWDCTRFFLIFVDLRKAYDSVPRSALWAALEKLGGPTTVIDLIRSFHDNMQAQIRVDGELPDGIGVSNGLRQGCCMAPTLFNLYSAVVVGRWG